MYNIIWPPVLGEVLQKMVSFPCRPLFLSPQIKTEKAVWERDYAKGSWIILFCVSCLVTNIGLSIELDRTCLFNGLRRSGKHTVMASPSFEVLKQRHATE